MSGARHGCSEPLKVTISNWPGPVAMMVGPWHGKNAELGERELPFSGSLYIEQADFCHYPTQEMETFESGRNSAPAVWVYHQV